MKVLVTGGAGFIGSYVGEALLQKGYKVRVLDNLDPQVHGSARKWPEYLTPDAEKVLGDVRDAEAVAAALIGCEAVIHLAAVVGVGQSMYEIERYSSANVLGTAVLLEQIIKQRGHIRKLIVASSMSVYGEGAYRANDEILLRSPRTRSAEQLKSGEWEIIDASGAQLLPIATPETKPCFPESVYAINKRDQEEMCQAIGKAYGIPAVAFRMFNVYGPRQALSNPYTGVVAIFGSRLLNRKPPLIFEDGKQRRDFVHVEDVARAYLQALESDNANGLTMNLGSGSSVTVAQIATTLANALNVSIAPVVTSKYREGDIRHCFADIGLIQEKLQWRPQWDFENGLGTLLEWLQNEKSLDKVNRAYSELEVRGLVK